MRLRRDRIPNQGAVHLPCQRTDGQAAVSVTEQKRTRSSASASWGGDAGRSWALALLCFLVCCGLGFQSWTALRVTGFDLGIFDQAIRSYAHFELPRSPIKNVHHEFPPGFSLLGDHFSPVLALLAPLYWVWDDPRMLIIAQAGLFALGVPVVRNIARRCFADATPSVAQRAADGAALVYALGWPLLNASYTGFHEVAFAVPLTLLMLERAMAHRYGFAALWAALLCMVKEDMGLVTGLFGLVVAIRAHRSGHRTGRAVGIAVMVAGPLVSAVVIAWFLPVMGSPAGYYWSYDRLGADPGGALQHILTEPWVVLQVAFTPAIKLAMLAWLLGTLALLPLGSPTVLLAVPLLAERMLSDNPNHWPVINHYDAFLWPILITATLETLARLHRSRSTGRGAGGRGLSARWAVAAVTLSSAAAVFLGLGLLVHPDSWRPSADKRALAEAAERIPDGATVEADNVIAPRLTSRADVVIVDGTPRGADWVLMREKKRAFPFAAVAEQRDRISLLLTHGYQDVWRRDGVVLLHRVSPVPVPGMSRPGPGSTPVREQVPADVGRNLFQR
ncbi:DUF2079 domain-containing protein [Streptomyces rimosus]|uniref:DUF2079 domain-containing protein n=1 Tax=Streptomyces rimosus TaxID=1927 RepID=UPI00099E47B3|nr:DUF2079 domain-containing protein [Streptomyces rimosus]